MEAEQLSQIIQWVKAGKTAEARQALRLQLRRDPSDERAWLWLADTMTETSQRIAVLEHALKSVPDSELLRRSLARLKIQQFAQAAPFSQFPGSEENNRTLPMSGVGGAVSLDEQAHQEITPQPHTMITAVMNSSSQSINPSIPSDHPHTGQKAISKSLSLHSIGQEERVEVKAAAEKSAKEPCQKGLGPNERMIAFRLALFASLIILLLSLLLLTLWRGL